MSPPGQVAMSTPEVGRLGRDLRDEFSEESKRKSAATAIKGRTVTCKQAAILLAAQCTGDVKSRKPFAMEVFRGRLSDVDSGLDDLLDLFEGEDRNHLEWMLKQAPLESNFLAKKNEPEKNGVDPWNFDPEPGKDSAMKSNGDSSQDVKKALTLPGVEPIKGLVEAATPKSPTSPASPTSPTSPTSPSSPAAGDGRGAKKDKEKEEEKKKQEAEEVEEDIVNPILDIDLEDQIKQLRAKQRFKETRKFNVSDSKPMSNVVSVAFKIWLIRDIFPIESTFKCRFRVFLEWLDEGAVGLPVQQKVEKDQLSRINIPEVMILNVLEYKKEEESSAPEVVNSENGHVAYQILFSATLQMEYDMSLFPFDSQWLSIVLGMTAAKDDDRTFFFQYCEVEEQKGLEEWNVHSSFAECDVLDGHARVTFGVLIQRLSRYYVVNVMVLLALISSLTFSLYVLGAEDFGERGKIFMAISLTQVTFKLSVENKLPKVAYSTYFDQYAITCQALLFIIAVENAAVAQLAKSDAETARRLEIILAIIFAIVWIGWNIVYFSLAYRVKLVQPRQTQALPPSLEIRRRNSMMSIASSKGTEPTSPKSPKSPFSQKTADS